MGMILLQLLHIKVCRLSLSYSPLLYHPNDHVLAPVVQKLDSAIHRINHYPVDNAIGFPTTYPLDSDLSGG